MLLYTTKSNKIKQNQNKHNKILIYDKLKIRTAYAKDKTQTINLIDYVLTQVVVVI